MKGRESHGWFYHYLGGHPFVCCVPVGFVPFLWVPLSVGTKAIRRSILNDVNGRSMLGKMKRKQERMNVRTFLGGTIIGLLREETLFEKVGGNHLGDVIYFNEERSRSQCRDRNVK